MSASTEKPDDAKLCNDESEEGESAEKNSDESRGCDNDISGDGSERQSACHPAVNVTDEC